MAPVSDHLAWFLTIQLMGLLATPMAIFLFKALPDRGYSLAKVLALLLAGYTLWVLGLTGVLPNSPATIAAILLVGGVVFAWLYYRRWPEIEEYLREQWRYILIVEGLFLATFTAWVFVISEVPAINHTEKPMDFAFLTSILQSPSFPPEDPWLSGYSISYYYFGHFMMALPMKLAGITSNAGYNLAMATIPALVVAGSFGLTYNLIRLSGGGFRSGILFGLFAPTLIAVAGNLEGVLELVQVRGWAPLEFWQWAGIKGLEGTTGGGFFPDSNWWWWRATRVIDTLRGGVSLDYTITEFPFFSFLLGDLHSHVLNLPFLLLVLALALNVLFLPEPIGRVWILRNSWHFGLLALALGALAFVNSWDFPVYGGIVGAVILAKALLSRESTGDANESGDDFGTRKLMGSVAASASLVVPLLVLSVLLYLPFYVTLSSQVSGILPYLGPGTRPIHFVLVMGGPAFLGLLFLWRRLQDWPRPAKQEASLIVMAVMVAVLPWLLWLVLAATWGALTRETDSLTGLLVIRTVTVVPGLAVAALSGYAALSLALRGKSSGTIFPLLLLAAAAYLLSGAELFHLADFFGNRMNTVFKVYYQAWLLLGIVGAFGIYYCVSRFKQLQVLGRGAQLALGGAACLLLIGALYYPVGATLDRTGVLGEHHDFSSNTLDGLQFIKNSHPGEYAAITWLRDEAAPGRIVEAVGEDYSEFSRVSAATGRPTILGWKGHEHQWRGTAETFQGREEDIARIYQSDDPLVVYRLLSFYDVRYVYMGHRERAKYGVSQPAALDGVFETAFKRDSVVIYEKISYSPFK